MTEFPADQAAFAQLISKAEQAKMTIGTAESLTGGLLGFLLARQEGAGEAFAGSIVAYQTGVKEQLLAVSKGPVVSARAAKEMALSACRLLDCAIAISLTGVAGPESQEGKPVGTVFIGLADGRGRVCVQEHRLHGPPDTVRFEAARVAATFALEWPLRLGEEQSDN